jgi:hypothetical protein
MPDKPTPSAERDKRATRIWNGCVLNEAYTPGHIADELTAHADAAVKEAVRRARIGAKVEKISRMIGPEIFPLREHLCSNCSGKGTGLVCSSCSEEWEKEIKAAAAKAEPRSLDIRDGRHLFKVGYREGWEDYAAAIRALDGEGEG